MKDKDMDNINYQKITKLYSDKPIDCFINKRAALFLLEWDLLEESAIIICKEYGEDDDWVEVLKEDVSGLTDCKYKTFRVVH